MLANLFLFDAERNLQWHSHYLELYDKKDIKILMRRLQYLELYRTL